MDTSIFTNKKVVPSEQEVIGRLSNTYELWKLLREYVFQKFPSATEEWNYPGAKYGWSYRIKDKKRAIIYFLPREGFFKVAFVFGQKAAAEILSGEVNEKIKAELKSARVFGEGRGIRIEMRGYEMLEDVKTLIDIKLAN